MKEKKQAEKFVKDWNPGSKLGKNVKLMEDGVTMQARIGATTRVQFNAEKEIIQIITKPNHKSHR